MKGAVMITVLDRGLPGLPGLSKWPETATKQKDAPCLWVSNALVGPFDTSATFDKKMKSRYMRAQLKALPSAIVFIALGVVFMYSFTVALAIVAAALFLGASGFVGGFSVDDWSLINKSSRRVE